MSMTSHSTVTLPPNRTCLQTVKKTVNDVWSAITSTADHTSLQLIIYS